MLAVPSVSSATVFPTDFSGPTLEAGLIDAGSPGTSYTVGQGKLVLKQAAGYGNGQVTVSALTPLTGDFVMSITASAVDLGRADLGIVLGSADWTYTLSDMFINDLGHSVNGNIFLPKFVGAFLPNSVEQMTLTIVRHGDQISDIFDRGSGPVIINSGQDPLLGGPATVSLFLLEAAGDTGAHSGTFSNFVVESLPVGSLTGQAVPEPGTTAMLGLGMIGLFGLTASRHRKTVVMPRA
jgi:hypothetical protein